MVSNHVQTLANSIIGTSILAMPFCFEKCGVILSIVLLIITTIITRCCCHYLIKASIVTRRRKIELLGFHMFGQTGKTMVELSCIGFLMGTCIAFHVVIGDLSPIIVSKIFNIQSYSHDSVRRFLIIIITICCVVPLSFQKSIESLAFVCRASIGFYICLTLKIVFESFERFESDSNWASNIDLWKPSGILQCIPIFSMAMSCQMQIFEVYETMGFSGSIDRMRTTVHQATFICCLVYCTVGFFGYLAFYNESLPGNILMKLQPSVANDAITIGFILSIACSFPLVIFPCRTALASFLHPKGHHAEIAAYVPDSKYKPITLFIIVSTMIVGILIPSVEVIISLVGSTIGVFVCVIFPATCFVKIMQRDSMEKKFAQVTIVIGFVIMILGTYANLNAIDTAKSGSHLGDKPSIVESIADQPKPEFLRDDEKKTSDVKSIEKVIPPPDIVKNKKGKEIEIKISEDGIKKEDQEIAVEKTKDPQVEIREKNEEIEVLKESKNQLEKEVKEIKEELKKQNKETQDLVLQKIEEIAEKVEKIEKISIEKEGNSVKEQEKPTIVEKKMENINLPEKKSEQVEDVKEQPKKEEKIVEPAPNDIKERVDPIVKLIQSKEPLSYQLGEKVMEAKKSNLSSAEILKTFEGPKEKAKEAAEAPKQDSEEKKNEMRKKRESSDFKEISLDLLNDELKLKNPEMKSMLSRDLKATDEDEA
ncbi:CLUMA_CG007839, isoform A [Clunio marinus]|uniref:CLUMA_CG007839, isoform A n=1 Tax=Clunio marinus TaxID=568069 RepID=A0A1J1I208_9DIPT|nr:CLUMA_CG007839, isoform A [Clunio marinus]